MAWRTVLRRKGLMHLPLFQISENDLQQAE